MVAATLAARLGLERVYPTDDHLSDRVQSDSPHGPKAIADAKTVMVAGFAARRLPSQAQAMEKALDDGRRLHCWLIIAS